MRRTSASVSAAIAAALVLILMLSAPGAALGWPGQKGVTLTPIPAQTKGAPPTPITAPTQTPAPPSGAIEVVSTLDVDLLAGPARTAAILAPNGERFAHLAGEEVCFYRINGTQDACYTPPEPVRLNAESVRWSPDSTRLLFMDNDLFRFFADTDIWTLDAATGQFTNLTDDGVTGGVLLKPVDADLDFSPVWSADGTQVAFLRMVQIQGDTGPVTIYTVPASGGEAVTRQVLTEFGRFRILNIAWAADGDTIAYFHDWRGGEDRMWSGIWLLKLSDPNPQRILTIDYASLPSEMAFSPDGSHLLVTLRTGKYESVAPEDFPAWVVPLNGGAPLAIDSGRIVRAAAWREGDNGPAIAYIVGEPANPDVSGLYFASGPGQPGNLALPGEFIGPATFGERLAWGANGVTLVAGRGGSPVTVVSTRGE